MERGSSVLEKLALGFKKLGKGVYSEISSKAYWVDTMTGHSFWMPAMTINEKYIQEFLYNDGSTWSEIGAARAIGAVMGFCINRPLTRFRDYWKKKVWRVNSDSSWVRSSVADFSLAVTLIPSLYALTLGLAGENLEEIKQMVPSGTGVQVVMAFVYTKYLDKSRKFFGTTPDYLLEDSLDRED